MTGAMSMSFLADNLPPKESNFPEKYLAGILRAVIQSAGAVQAAQIWRSGKLTVETFVSQDRIKDFAESNVSLCLI